MPAGGMDFEGQSVIVTGGATGIGEATSKLFVEHGASVAIFDFDPVGTERVVGEIKSNRGDAHGTVVDLTDLEKTRDAVEAVLARNGKIDVLVHCAGGFPKYISLLDAPIEAWDTVIDSNLKSLFYLLKLVAPKMVAANYGRIVAVSSMAVRGSKIVSAPYYAAAKAGEIGLIQQAAKVLGRHGITANAVAPGAVRTPRTNAMRTEEAEARIRETTPVGRLSQPVEIAWPILFLSSREAGYITGTTLDVNGGASMM